MSMRSVLRRTSQALACATALGSGAALAHLTHAEAQSGTREWAPRQPITLTSSSRSRADRRMESPSQGATESGQELPLGVAPPPPDPFGEHLRDGMVMTGATRHRLLLFTFDDGPELRTTPTLLNTVLSSVVRAHRGDLDFCVSRAVRMAARELGEVTLRLTITPEGVVSDVQLSGPGASQPLRACLSAKARTWAFPRPGGSLPVQTQMRLAISPH